MSDNFTCPRRVEDGLALADSPLRNSGPNLDQWRPDHRCSYCGSLHPDKLMELLVSGDATLTPTDKSYKVYVDHPNPNAGNPVLKGVKAGPAFGMDGKPSVPDLTPDEIKAGRYRREQMGPAPAKLTSKFYFQHFSVEQRQQFVGMLNVKQIKFGFPGHFYVAPFFIKFGD